MAKKYGRATAQETTNFSHGQYDSDYTETAGATIGGAGKEYNALRFWSASVVDTIVKFDGSNHWSTGKTFARGDVLYGRFQSCKITSGSVEGFRSFPFEDID